MEDYSKIVEEKNRTMSFEEYKEQVSKSETKTSKFKKFLKKVISIPGKAIMAFFGIDRDSIMSSRKSGHSGHGEHGGGGGYTPPSAASFRDQHHFDPERAYIERIQERAYMQMVDGKGDPEPCNCDHDR